MRVRARPIRNLMLRSRDDFVPGEFESAAIATYAAAAFRTAPRSPDGTIARRLDTCGMAIEKNPRLTSAWVVLARTRRDAGLIGRAVEAYQHVLVLDPGYRTAGDALNRLRR